MFLSFIFLLLVVDLLTLFDKLFCLLETIYFSCNYFVSHIITLDEFNIKVKFKIHIDVIHLSTNSIILLVFSQQLASTVGKMGFESKFAPWVLNGISRSLSEDNDIRMWKMKIQTKLTQQKSIISLKGETLMHARLTQWEKTKMLDNAIIILCLEDKVQKEVTKEKNLASVWRTF